MVLETQGHHDVETLENRLIFFINKGRVKKKQVIFITLGSAPPPPLQSDNHFFGN